jgi:Smg protein
LFELLLSLVEKTLTHLKEKQQLLNATNEGFAIENTKEVKKVSVEVQMIKEADARATRVFTQDERLKFTKASHQFLARLSSLGIVSTSALELVINRLYFSESRFVSLQETKWTIRNTLASTLTSNQMAFLELILYSKEDGFVLH